MISIILTSFKEPKTIGRAIESIQNNYLEDYEILVVAPDKETLAVAKDYSLKDKRIRPIKDLGKGKPNALNLAIPKTKGEIIILTDGDVYVGKDSFKELLKKFKDKKVGAVCGHPVSLDSKKTMMGYWAHVLTNIANEIRIARSKENRFILCSGYLFAIRRNIIGKIPINVLDDAYISQEIWNKGYKITYSKKAKVFIKNPTTLKDWIKQKKRNAFGEFQIRKNSSSSMRGFSEEFLGFFKIFLYPKNFNQILWSFLLVSARLYIWISATYHYKIKKEDMKNIWVRVETTK